MNRRLGFGPGDRKRNQQRKRKNERRSGMTHGDPMAAKSKRGKRAPCLRCGEITMKRVCPECGGCPRCGSDFTGYGAYGRATCAC